MQGPAAFDPERFVEACRSALAEAHPEKAIRSLLERAVADPAPIQEALGEPRRAGVHPLCRSDELTVLHVVWAPGMTILPHDHRMWAAIGVYGGREDNIFWRRLEPGARPGIEAAGARSLGPGDALPLGREVVHSVTNPTRRFTGALHVYGGDFFAVERSEWEPESLAERPYDVEKNVRLFAEANARLGEDA